MTLGRRTAIVVAMAAIGLGVSDRAILAVPQTLTSTSPGSATGPVTFNRHIAPVIFTYCGSCHHPGGDAPFSLVTYQEARRRATLIASATASRRMPPWRVETDYGEFPGLEQLPDPAIAMIRAWAASGAPEGELGDLPLPPSYKNGWQLGAPDLVVTLPQPYTLAADGRDEYRTFVIPLHLSTTRFVRGLEFRPEVAGGVIHHANILLDGTSRSRDLDAEDPEPGYAGPVARSAVSAEGHFLGYVPGKPDPLLPRGMAWRLEPGSDLVVQLHLNHTGKPESIHPSIGLYFTDDEPGLSPLLMRMGRRTIDIAPGETGYRITDSYVAPVDVQIVSVKPHAHYLARTVAVAATLSDGSTRRLIRVPSWDFRWQNVYRFGVPVDLPKGSRLSIEFTFDNSEGNVANPSRPARRVRWGPESTDEMADVWIQVRTRNDDDRRTLARDFGRKAAAEEAAGYRELLERSPEDPVINDDLALLDLELGRSDDAVVHFERSLRTRPESAAAHFNLATALTSAGQTDRAIGEFETAIGLKPDYAAAHNNLGNLLSSVGQTDRAMSHFITALSIDPKYPKAHNGRATILMQQGNLLEAVQPLQTAVQLAPDFTEAHRNLALVQHALGSYGLAAQQYEKALALQPDSSETLAAYAWLLATAPDDRTRRGTLAVELAEKADRLGAHRDRRALEALAAGYAELGLFDKALTASDLALRLTPRNSASLAGLGEQQALYRRGLPVRTAAPLP